MFPYTSSSLDSHFWSSHFLSVECSSLSSSVQYRNTLHYIAIIWYLPYLAKLFWTKFLILSRYPCSLTNLPVFCSLPASLHPQQPQWLWLCQPPRGQHSVRLHRHAARPAPALLPGVAPGPHTLPGGSAACPRGQHHLRAGTELRRELPSSLCSM